MFRNLSKLNKDELKVFITSHNQLYEYAVSFLEKRINAPLTQQVKDILHVHLFEDTGFNDNRIRFLIIPHTVRTGRVWSTFGVDIHLTDQINSDGFEVENVITTTLRYLVPIIEGEFHDPRFV